MRDGSEELQEQYQLSALRKIYFRVAAVKTKNEKRRSQCRRNI